MSESYREPIKHLARQRSLVHAIRILTTARTESTVIKVDEVEEVLDYAVGILGDPTIAKEAREEFITWTDIHKARVGIKRPGDLNVLYLCGPSPLNDLEILLELGISPHNVWAVEADESIAGKAVKQLANRGVAVKLHSGPLAEFLEALPEVFDLLYLDACGPLLGRRPSTLAPVLVAATHRRLAPYGVLVTNFSEMPSEQCREYAGVMASYFRYRFNDFPDALWRAGLDPALCEGDDTGLEEAVLCNADACYSELITRFIVDAFRGFAPSLRAFASHAFSGALMIRDRKGPIERARNLPRNAKSVHEFIETAGDMVLNKASYPLFSFYEDLGRRAPQSPLFAQLTNLSLIRARFPEALCQTELLSHIIEGH